MRRVMVRRLNEDGSVCRRGSPWTSATEGSWVSVVEADGLEAAALAAAKQWASYVTWPVIVEVGYQDDLDTKTYFSVGRVVTTNYPVRRINRPKAED